MSTVVSTSPAPASARPWEAAPRGLLVPLAVRPLHLAGLVLCALVFCGWLAAERGAVPFRAALFFGLFVLSAYYLGRLLLRAVPYDGPLAGSFALIFLAGSLSWSLLLFALHSLLPGSLPWHALALLAAAALGQVLIHRRRAWAVEERGAAVLGLFVVAFSLAAATCWARGLLHPAQRVDDQVEFRHWSDYFDHTGFTAQFLAPEHLWRFGHYELANRPAPVYHYGSYLAPACLASFGPLSAYDAVVSFWTPFGTFLVGLAAFVLASALGGRTAGLCGLVALLVLPDASYYGFRNPWFRYHWLQQIGSAGMYGASCAALALVALLEARRTRSRRALAAGLALGAATFWFKAQLFVVIVPLLVAWVVLCYPTYSLARRVLLLGGVIALGLGGIALSNHFHWGPRLEPSREYFEHYCKYAAAEGRPGALRAEVEKGSAAVGWPRYYLAGTSLVLLSSFGVLLAAWPLLGLGAWWRRRLHPLDLVPWLAVALYTLLLVGLKDNVIGVCWWELIHRPFVWPYFVLAVWCAGKGCVLLRETALGGRLLSPVCVGAVGVLLLALPWHMGQNAQPGRMSWRSKCCDLRFPQGLVECGRFVAAHGPRSDLVQDSRYDEHLVFGALSERRSYLARPELWKELKDPAVPPEVERRRALLERFKSVATTEAVRELAAQTGIRWYLLHPDDRAAWPQEILASPAFRCDGFAVYDLGSTTSVASAELGQKPSRDR